MMWGILSMAIISISYLDMQTVELGKMNSMKMHHAFLYENAKWKNYNTGKGGGWRDLEHTPDSCSVLSFSCPGERAVKMLKSLNLPQGPVW